MTEQVTAKGQPGLSPARELWETFWGTHFRAIPPEGQGSWGTDPPPLPVTVGLLPGAEGTLRLWPAMGLARQTPTMAAGRGQSSWCARGQGKSVGGLLWFCFVLFILFSGG